MGVFERIKSAVAGSIPVEDDLDMGDSQRVKNLPSSADPNDAVPETEAQSKADAAESNAESYADTEIENHRTGQTHALAQPPQNHGNGVHSKSYITSADAPVQSVNGETGDVNVPEAPNATGTTNDTSSRQPLGDFGISQPFRPSGDTYTLGSARLNHSVSQVVISGGNIDGWDLVRVEADGSTVFSGAERLDGGASVSFDPVGAGTITLIGEVYGGNSDLDGTATPKGRVLSSDHAHSL